MDDESARRILNESEYERFLHKKNKRRQAEFLTTRKGIKELLGDDTQVSIDYGILGYPIILGDKQNRQISISHCKKYAAVAIGSADMMIGIDIEDILDKERESLENAISEKEHAFEEMFENIEHFRLVMWTAKEALSKFLRIGMTADWSIFEISDVKKCFKGYKISFRYFPSLNVLSSKEDKAVYSVICPGINMFEIEE